MTLLAETITLIISAMILAKAAHTVIKSSVTIAKITRLGELVTGFLILSIVSGFPELIISTRAAASGNSGIAIGSVLGSNITSICFVIGLIGFLRPITVTEETLKKLTTMLLLCCLSLVFLLISTYFRWVGIAFLFLYFLFVSYSVKRKIVLHEIGTKHLYLSPKFKFTASFYKPVLLLFGGLIFLIVSAWFLVNSASNIASITGISGSFIGGTIISFCATIPELSIALESIKKGHVNLGLGDSIGECLTNLTLVLGIVSLISPFSIDKMLNTLIIFFFFSTILLWIFLVNISRRKLKKIEGMILLMVYFMFLILTYAVSFHKL